MSRRADADWDGVLPVDKPVGPTSHDMVARARRALGTRRIGHTGTLDPFASGLLLLCLGPSTRLAEYLTGLPKTYRATLRLGTTTDTDDLTGEVIGESDAWRALDEPAVRAALAAQTGEIEQLPPVYSAKKVGGERAYAAARAGREVERKPVRVTVYRIEATRVELPEVDFEVECSSGTYIRAIARDVGEALGTGGHLGALRRTRIGDHAVAGAVASEALDDGDAVRAALLDPVRALRHLPRVELSPDEIEHVSHGRALQAPGHVHEGVPIALVGPGGALLAIGEREGERLRPRKVFT